MYFNLFYSKYDRSDILYKQKLSQLSPYFWENALLSDFLLSFSSSSLIVYLGFQGRSLQRWSLELFDFCFQSQTLLTPVLQKCKHRVLFHSGSWDGFRGSKNLLNHISKMEWDYERDPFFKKFRATSFHHMPKGVPDSKVS